MYAPSSRDVERFRSIALVNLLFVVIVAKNTLVVVARVHWQRKATMLNAFGNPQMRVLAGIVISAGRQYIPQRLAAICTRIEDCATYANGQQNTIRVTDEVEFAVAFDRQSTVFTVRTHQCLVGKILNVLI